MQDELCDRRRAGGARWRRKSDDRMCQRLQAKGTLTKEGVLQQFRFQPFQISALRACWAGTLASVSFAHRFHHYYELTAMLRLLRRSPTATRLHEPSRFHERCLTNTPCALFAAGSEAARIGSRQEKGTAGAHGGAGVYQRLACEARRGAAQGAKGANDDDDVSRNER